MRKTGSLVQQAAFQNMCHSEPVLKLVWESPSSLRTDSSIDGDCEPACALARNDRKFGARNDGRIRTPPMPAKDFS